MWFSHSGTGEWSQFCLPPSLCLSIFLFLYFVFYIFVMFGFFVQLLILTTGVKYSTSLRNPAIFIFLHGDKDDGTPSIELVALGYGKTYKHFVAKISLGVPDQNI